MRSTNRAQRLPGRRPGRCRLRRGVVFCFRHRATTEWRAVTFLQQSNVPIVPVATSHHQKAAIRHKCLVILILCVAVNTQVAFARKWTNASGKFTVEADFVAFKDGKVQLKKSNGQSLSLPVEQLVCLPNSFVKKQADKKEPEHPEPVLEPGSKIPDEFKKEYLIADSILLTSQAKTRGESLKNSLGKEEAERVTFCLPVSGRVVGVAISNFDWRPANGVTPGRFRLFIPGIMDNTIVEVVLNGKRVWQHADPRGTRSRPIRLQFRGRGKVADFPSRCQTTLEEFLGGVDDMTFCEGLPRTAALTVEVGRHPRSHCKRYSR